MGLHEEIGARLADVRQRLRQAAARAGRQPDDVRLLAVSKTFSLDHVRAAAAAGQAEFGENRVQEALQKIEGSADLKIRWHLVGTLQSNKVRKAVTAFGAIQSVDSLGLLESIDRAAAEAGSNPQLLVQVDLAGEATKHGAPPEAAKAIVRAGVCCRAARLAGLMTIPPYFDNPEKTRPYFAALRELRATLLAGGLEPESLRELSMGMSHDFEIAVQEGATMVRLGTAIFGARHV
ncbi:MAG TPA: YggS family pyridoxal phosphate-dependent enzyme [Vicinamibacterales bacterium]|jgi:pyridoxal phosphate enzyme (YggS family)|nr:YggS family pyridoxal phosphate-dependent enzyme [Vicinamibacterales bacterium]